MNREPSVDRRLPEYRDEVASDEFWRAMKPRREPLNWRPFVPSVLVLLALNVPWWLPEGLGASLLLGLPLFVWTALLTSLALAALTAWAALRHWQDDEEEERVEELPEAAER